MWLCSLCYGSYPLDLCSVLEYLSYLERERKSFSKGRRGGSKEKGHSDIQDWPGTCVSRPSQRSDPLSLKFSNFGFFFPRNDVR